jgi:hypothetical protein
MMAIEFSQIHARFSLPDYKALRRRAVALCGKGERGGVGDVGPFCA